MWDASSDVTNQHNVQAHQVSLYLLRCEHDVLCGLSNRLCEASLFSHVILRSQRIPRAGQVLVEDVFEGSCGLC